MILLTDYDFARGCWIKKPVNHMRVNWGFIGGVVVALAVSAVFWAGIWKIAEVCCG
jgi:hypothetical protein